MSTAELQPSKLGTKEHWDSVYEEEFDNFEEIGDEGEIWFGVESVEKMVEWAIEHVPPSPDTSILEIGSGNGTLLFALVDAGYASEQLSGIDYSAGSIKLAQAIAKTRGAENITFNLCDFLKEDPPLLPQNSQDSRHAAWDLIMDKGTFDAIALMKPDEDGNAPVANYPRHIAELLKPGCLYLITCASGFLSMSQVMIIN
ncbi:hypothetical protein SERLA73DRAFT_73469 [Serpula lacrymans var. lacrymans S7.3]|uniref:Methyltransferase domain-containing protein n=1 Tax=Serpula lacrymans var. lacrymans (strain S7.3) TaxID=936435 RepID=F8PYC0_SERL3|nr:hypothetical protein SERLA73DRAFT_73469 [Serpula lacrymans var. lacrymans S7.3]